MMVWIYAEETHQMVGTYEMFHSLRMVRRYQGHGEIEISAPLDTARFLFWPGVVIWAGADQEAYIIDTVKIEQDERWGRIIHATGFTASRMLASRTLIENAVVEESAGAVIAHLIISTLNQDNRYFSKTDLHFPATGDSVIYESQPEPLDEAVFSLCKASGIGLRSRFDILTERLSIETYQGVDHTIETVFPVVFAPEYENIAELSYANSANPWKNVVYVLGEQPKEEGQTRVLVAAGENHLTSFARREAVVESNLSRTVTEEDGGTREQTDEEYLDALRQYGDEYLAKTGRIVSCEGEIIVESPLIQFGVDYGLGDLVTFQYKEFELNHDVRITEIEDAYEGGRHTTRVVLGDPMPTVFDRIKLR